MPIPIPLTVHVKSEQRIVDKRGKFVSNGTGLVTRARRILPSILAFAIWKYSLAVDFVGGARERCCGTCPKSGRAATNNLYFPSCLNFDQSGESSGFTLHSWTDRKNVNRFFAKTER